MPAHKAGVITCTASIPTSLPMSLEQLTSLPYYSPRHQHCLLQVLNRLQGADQDHTSPSISGMAEHMSKTPGAPDPQSSQSVVVSSSHSVHCQKQNPTPEQVEVVLCRAAASAALAALNTVILATEQAKKHMATVSHAKVLCSGGWNLLIPLGRIFRS